MEIKKLNLYEKIQAVSNEIKNIEKDMVVGKGTASAYKAVSDLAVTLAVKDAETKYKLLSVPFKQEIVNTEIIRVQGNNGERVQYVDNIKMTIRIIDLEDITQFIDIEAFGKGVDSADKGFGKASTYARKYGLLNAYKIATGEDPDADKSKEETPAGISDKKKAVLDILTKDDAVKENVLQHFSKGDIKEFTDKEIETIYDNFKSKKLL